MNLSAIKTGENVLFEINGIKRTAKNRVVKTDEKNVFVQVNDPGTVMHSTIFAFPKETNEFFVSGGYGKAVYKIHHSE